MSTPLMRQYASMKAKYPGTILLFRLGDFYETFEEDARTTSAVLGITLTKRGNGAAGEIPLAGFPHHALESYLPKLLKAGHRVAICEQLEDPRFARGIVKRDVVEVMTPGVAFSESLLERSRNNYLLAVALPHHLAAADDAAGLAFIDVTTAEFHAVEMPVRQLSGHISSIAPSEILVQKRDRPVIEELLAGNFTGLYTTVDDWVFNTDYARRVLVDQFRTQTLKGFGIEEWPLAITAAGAVMNYLRETQKSNLLHVRKVSPYAVGDHILLDEATKRNLEISRTREGGDEGTLFRVLDRTKTPMGARLLKRWVHQPLRKTEPISARLDAVGELAGNGELRKSLARTLSGIGDLERLIARISTGRANPREVLAMKSMLARISILKADLDSGCGAKVSPDGSAAAASPTLVKLGSRMVPMDELVSAIGSALSPDPPASLSDGNVIREGYDRELDELRDIAVNGKSWIAALQTSERQRTGIPSLKVGYNNVFGYYIEVTNTHRDRVPASFTRKQTLANAERYITPELKEYEEKILNAEERILSLETRLFNDLRTKIAECTEPIQENAQLVAMLDCFSSLADAASEYGYVRPEIDEGTTIEIVDGRHPVIERLLPPGESYTPNSTLLDREENQLLIITGPNMSGKSSYLRQVGLIVLLAQIGSFVPAKSARIGLVDRIFTRVGASDNIAAGESTFLVEMHEAANIVNTATPRSLVLLDEIGRGTSTFDGISIAWALSEYLHNRIGAKTLFATHYHELNELADLFPRIKNLKVEVREYGDKVIFLHKVTPGFADHSYGIQVAQMAGLPEEVTERAKHILRNLEGSGLTVHGEAGGPRQTQKTKGRIAPAEMQMTLFEMKDDRLREKLKDIDVDKMTPLEALQRLAELKRTMEGES